MEVASARGSTGALSSSADSVTGHMHHSMSTPAGVDGGGSRTPPTTPKKGGKMLAMRVQMLDDTITIFQVQAKALGRVLFDQVCKQLHLLEADYFGLEYADCHGTRYWLDLQKPISRQLGLSLVDPILYFCVKFYTPDPAQLEEEYTRYLFCLQVKRDLAQGYMQCNENTASLMASYIVQAECGDFVPEDYPDHTYLSSYKFVPHQDHEMEKKIMENHKKHTGQSPAEADLNLLETARRCELYGMKMHPAKDHENVCLNLAVAHMGILVFQNYTKINTFSWAKIRKISFKRKKFLIKLHPEGYGFYKDTVEFFFEGRNECKNFWKKCVENHGFFRCSAVKNVSRHKTRVLSRGSSFRYSGKTQKQVVEFVRDNYVKRQTFQRSHSFRHSSAHSSASNMHASAVGNSISAHPLLPLADSSLSAEASKLSASLGSMRAGDGTVRPVSPTTRSVSHRLGIATSWSSVPDTTANSITSTATKQQRGTVGNAATVTTAVPRPPAVVPTTSSPSPTGTRSGTDEGSPSPLGSPLGGHSTTTCAATASRRPASPLAVRAAVHRADTGITIHTHITSRTPSSHKSDGNLDFDPLHQHHHHHGQTQQQSFAQNYVPSQTQSQNDLGTSPRPQSPTEAANKTRSPPKRKLWQRSASCRDLYDFSFEETGKAKQRRAKSPKMLEKGAVSLDERKQDSPVTVYDDHRALYSASSRDSSLEIQQDIMVPCEKIYSSSFPGTTSYSQESVEDPGNYDLRDSQDDLSHDSYELIEKSDDSTSGDYKKTKPFNTRSCSLDSGNYLPSDSESDLGAHQKYKSVSDHDIFLMEDPRDFPREIIPRKSDGSFYKQFKQSSRTSSLESKSDYFESKASRSSKESLRKSRGVGSRTSSQESKSDNEPVKKSIRKGVHSERRHSYYESRTSSADSKSEYFDASTKHDDFKFMKKHNYDRKITFERNYGTQKPRVSDTVLPAYPDFANGFQESTYPVVETEQSKRVDKILSDIEQHTLPIAENISCRSETSPPKTTHIWPESIVGLPTEIENVKQHTSSGGQRSTESESNIFSFDEDRIQSLQESSDFSDHGFGVVPNIEPKKKEAKSYRDVFMEIEPRICHDLPLHQPIERTKSDPNSLARQRFNSGNRRLLLMHQKSIDLTPAESSDEDYLYKQIPSAPPITKFKGERFFEIPSAEFGHFDILKREIEGQKTKFEVPKSQFEVLGAKTQADLMNLPPKGEDIPYVLHKRLIMNGTAQEEAAKRYDKDPKDILEVKPESSFLFTQNIDLSKVNPVTLEVDKSVPAVQLASSPKRDITHIDPAVLETLNSKLSQIESDSPTSSRTESLKPIQRILSKGDPPKSIKPIEEKTLPKLDEKKADVPIKPKICDKIKTDIKPKRVIKPRMQPGKRGGKTSKNKVRITSFSSDDESLDSDDVFGSAEATPTKIEFSPPQMRKEMESILKFESERKYLQYTMSSTEVEGSPPTTRKKVDKHSDNGLDPNAQQTELRRISERSFSIPSSEDEFNIKASDMAPVFAEPSDQLKTVEEVDREDADKSLDETLKEDLSRGTDNELTTIDDERAREKAVLQAEIENDLKDLKVPSKTKITEIMSPSLRNKRSHSPLVFAHARLNLSEGSAFTLLQKQQAVDSPLPNRRARSLDAPIIPVNKLPPLNSFSIKDDTVDEEDQNENFISATSTEVSDAETGERVRSNGVVPHRLSIPTLGEMPRDISKEGSFSENDQIVPDVTNVKKKPPLAKGKPKLPPRGVAPPRPTKEPSSKKPIANKLLASKPKAPDPKEPPSGKPPLGPKSSSTESKQKEAKSRQRLLTEKAASAENESRSDDDRKTSASLTLPEIKRTKSQEMEPNRKATSKEKARSLEKLELKRIGSKDRTKSQEESEEVIAERRKLQQMLYETAIKQTKTLKSPVKDVLPVFPQVEETVRERGGKLEISINTIEPNVSLEEAIIVTKSPKKLDKKLDKKLTKSLELNLSTDDGWEKGVQRMGKSLDLERSKSEDEAEKSVAEFDFKPETIKSMNDRDKLEAASPEIQSSVQKTVTAEVHTEAETQVILEGTSLDVWLSVSDKKPNEKLKDIEVIRGDAGDFFERRSSPKAPDLGLIDAKSKSSSDSVSTDKVSLGNSLDIKYIDESTESSCKSEKDRELIAEMQKASQTVSKFIRKKLERRRKDSDEVTVVPEGYVRITSEDESLTEISDILQEPKGKNLLTVTVTDHKDALLKLNIERSRSEDTASSWMTVDCEEFIGAESSLDYDLESPLEKKMSTEETDLNLLGADAKQAKLKFIKRGSDQSKSSDTGSWTSGEKELSPSNVKETDESSVSCSMGRAIGLSQNIEMFASKEQMEKGSSHSSDEPPRSPRSPRICVLGRAFTIDEGSQKLDESSSDEANEIPKDLAPIEEGAKESTDSDNGKVKKPYPFEKKWAQDSELTQKLHKKLSKKLSSAEKGSLSSIDDSYSLSKRSTLDKPNLLAVEKLSTESRNSLDTESSSGSLGVAMRAQKSSDIPKELSSTWKPFPLDSSGSESIDDNLLPPDQDIDKHEYFMCRDNSSGDFTSMTDVYYKPDDITATRDDTELPEDLANFPTNFGYPCITSLPGATDILSGYSGGAFLSRTLSRISERSTNSEKSSLDEDSTKASTQSDSLNDESMASSNPQISVSSESPSHAHVYDEKKTPTNEKMDSKRVSKQSDKPSTDPAPNFSSLLQRQISDDRRTSAEMAELSMDDIEIITSERGLRLKRQGSDDTIIDEECFEDLPNKVEKQSSQESEEWPLPEIPNQGQKNLLAMHEVPSSDTSAQLTTQLYQPPSKNIPKTFGLRGSLKSQDSEQWPSPPSSVQEPIVENIETFYISPAEEACRVTVESQSTHSYDNESNSEEYKTIDFEMEKTHTYENVAVAEHVSESLSDSQSGGSIGPSGIKIVLEEKLDESNSDEDLNISNLNDDVFVDISEAAVRSEQLRPPTALRRSTASDDSRSERRSSPAGSHSSYSEEDCTSSMGTNIEDGTVRFALKPSKCTHSSHSEDTSIALSLSEWSNSTNTVKFQNLSSNSGTTKSSSGLKSDENSLTDIAQSISEWSTTQSSTLKAQQTFQKLSSTTSTGESTLTERIPSISDWSNSDSKPLGVTQQFFPAAMIPPERTPTRLGSSIDIEDSIQDQRSPKNIPSEDFSIFAASKPGDVSKFFTKSTERPMVIPVPIQSDTDKSSSSLEHKTTVHTQRYDKDKKGYLQKYHSNNTKSTDRPVKVNLKLAKCSPYYSSSLSSESTPLTGTSPIPISKTATVPLTRAHNKRPMSRSLTHAKSPPSENDSTSSVESPKSKSERERRGFRRKRQLQQQRNKAKIITSSEKEQCFIDEYYYVEHEHGLTEYSEYIRERNMEEMASNFQYEAGLAQDSPVPQYRRQQQEEEGGYFPDGDSQSGSDIFRMEREEEDKQNEFEGFDVSSIPPPLLEDDFEGDPSPHI